MATFQAALEQAEQQFRAAATIDPDSRALNLFYGLSQAGRAIAAASPKLPNGHWQLNGHGLTSPSGNDNVKSLKEVVVQSSGSDKTSFRRLSAVLDSHQPDKVSLGELWPMIHDTHYGPGLGSDTIYVPLDVHVQPAHLPSLDHVEQAATIELPARLKATPVELRPTMSAFFARYPSLAGWEHTNVSGSTVGWPDPNTTFRLRWEKPDGVEMGHALDGRLTPYRGIKLAMPTLGDADSAMHPLMVWWVVLYALAMLTRYQPDEWTRLIDINRSPHAVAIEHLLEVAVVAVPDIIDETIAAIATGSTIT